MQTGIDTKTLRCSTQRGHATMTDLIYLTIPSVGRIYIQHGTVTIKQWSSEVMASTAGKELYLCCGRMRIYLTPASTLRNEGKAHALGGADTH
jgi:hypothetical protein